MNRKIALASTVLAATSVLAACGGSSSSNNAAAEKPAAAAAKSETSAPAVRQFAAFIAAMRAVDNPIVANSTDEDILAVGNGICDAAEIPYDIELQALSAKAEGSGLDIQAWSAILMNSLTVLCPANAKIYEYILSHPDTSSYTPPDETRPYGG